MITAPPALSVRGIVKRFGRTIALDEAALDVRAGTLHALLGENGAGKTTLMQLVFGMLRADAGEVRVEGVLRHWRSSADAIAAGIGMVHQHFMLIPAMTVAENVALGEGGLLSSFDPRVVADRVRRLGSEAGLTIDPQARVATLPVGAQQRLEIVKALARDAHLLILDEPTAVLTPSEAQELYAWLRRFVDGGRTAILITHKVREALAVSDEVTVLRRGKTVLSAATKWLHEDQVVGALLGGTVPSAVHAAQVVETPATGGTSTATVATLEHVSAKDASGVTRLRDVTLKVQAGEIVGVAGVEGAGQHELMRVLAGRQLPTSGSVRLPARIGFVPEDRVHDALIESMALTENLALKEAGVRHGRMPWSKLHARTAEVIESREVRSANPATLAGALSGGNQQKFVLGRELEGAPELLVIEHPVRGLDVRAAAQVFDGLRSARQAGVAIVMYSGDLEELLVVSDRTVVCFGGRVSQVAADPRSLARALVGAT